MNSSTVPLRTARVSMSSMPQAISAPIKLAAHPISVSSPALGSTTTLLHDCFVLFKVRVVALVLVTGWGGYYLGAMQSGAPADIVMGEFWSGGSGHPSIKLVSSIAHIYGKTIVRAESFTASPEPGRWQNDPYQLKTIQEIISLIVFSGFAITYFGAPLRWNYAVGFALIALAAFFIFKKW